MTKINFKRITAYFAAVCMTACIAVSSDAFTAYAAEKISPGMYVTNQTVRKADSAKSEAGKPKVIEIAFDKNWKYAEYSAINSGIAKLYSADANRKNIVIGVNAGHGTKGGASVKTFCHPDGTPKVTGGSTAAGSVKATAVSSGMTFKDGTPESKVNLRQAQILKEVLLAAGYDVLMIRDDDDVQLDNIARTVMCNQLANCHIAIHWDSDGLKYDKGCFFMSVPNGLKNMQPVANVWELDDQLGRCLITGLKDRGLKIFGEGNMDMDLTQTSYSSIPSVDIELGNQSSTHTDNDLYERAYGILAGINKFYGKS